MTGEKDRVPATRGWLRDNPYLLLALAALFWSGNHIVGRAIGGEVPPIGISTVRWLLPTIALGIFAFPHIKRDWPVIRAHWGILLWLGIVGGALFTAGQYIGLQYTTALNVSVLNSLVPVLIIATGGIIFRDRITPVQLCGILISSIGVLVIIARGQLSNLQHLQFNWGDIIIVFNMMVFAVYAVLSAQAPADALDELHLCLRRHLGSHDAAVHGVGNGSGHHVQADMVDRFRHSLRLYFSERARIRRLEPRRPIDWRQSLRTFRTSRSALHGDIWQCAAK